MKQKKINRPGFNLSAGRTIQGIVFDLDGVLFDTEPLHREAWKKALEEMGMEVSSEELMSWTGVPCQQISAELEKRWKGRYSRDEYYNLKDKHFVQIINSRDSLFKGLTESLEALSIRVPIAVATAGSRGNVEMLLSNSGIAGFFKAVVCYEDVVKHKPDPEVYLKASRLIDVEPKNCIALDDSPAGCASALSAGMFTLGVASSFPPSELENADEIYPSTLHACRRIMENLEIRK